MSGELIPREELEKSKNGKYHISYQQLLRLPLERYEEIDAAMTALVQTNPDYEFTVSEDFIDRGQTIHWRYIGADREDSPAFSRQRDVLREGVRPAGALGERTGFELGVREGAEDDGCNDSGDYSA